MCSSLERAVPSSVQDSDAAQVQTIRITAGLNGGVGIHVTIAVVIKYRVETNAC
jgi:hypothetical protein